MDKANEAQFDLTLQSLDLHSGQSVLEIGFGSGQFIPRLFAKEPALHLTGLDYSPEIVAIAQAANPALIQSGQLTLQEGSSNQMPFDSDTFDSVYSNMVIFFWDKPEEHLREIHRVLKPGGKLYSGFRTKKSMQSFPFVRFGFTLYEPAEWQAILENNGFHIIRTDRQQDPPQTVNGQPLQLESVCVIAQK
jgi:ubiquinone/menaquinone biosynthesis C-methylase UbiE